MTHPLAGEIVEGGLGEHVEVVGAAGRVDVEGGGLEGGFLLGKALDVLAQELGEALGAEGRQAFADLFDGEQGCAAGHEGAAAGMRADVPGVGGRVGGIDEDPVGHDAEAVGDGLFGSIHELICQGPPGGHEPVNSSSDAKAARIGHRNAKIVSPTISKSMDSSIKPLRFR